MVGTRKREIPFSNLTIVTPRLTFLIGSLLWSTERHLWGHRFCAFSSCNIRQRVLVLSQILTQPLQKRGEKELHKWIKPCSDIIIASILVLEFLNLYVYVRQYFFPYSSDIVFSILSQILKITQPLTVTSDKAKTKKISKSSYVNVLWLPSLWYFMIWFLNAFFCN